MEPLKETVSYRAQVQNEEQDEEKRFVPPYTAWVLVLVWLYPEPI